MLKSLPVYDTPELTSPEPYTPEEFKFAAALEVDDVIALDVADAVAEVSDEIALDVAVAVALHSVAGSAVSPIISNIPPQPKHMNSNNPIKVYVMHLA